MKLSKIAYFITCYIPVGPNLWAANSVGMGAADLLQGAVNFFLVPPEFT